MLGHHIYNKNSFSAWKISRHDIQFYVINFYLGFFFLSDFSDECHSFDEGVLKGFTAMFRCSGMLWWTIVLAVFYLFWVTSLFVSQCHQVYYYFYNNTVYGRVHCLYSWCVRYVSDAMLDDFNKGF